MSTPEDTAATMPAPTAELPAVPGEAADLTEAFPPVADTLTMPAVEAEPETAATGEAAEVVTEPPAPAPAAQEADRDDPYVTLAAQVAAVNEEVERRMAANLAGIAESCEALDIELNAYVADAIKGRADYENDARRNRAALCERGWSIVREPKAHHSALVAATLDAVPLPAAVREAWTAPLALYDGSRDGSAA